MSNPTGPSPAPAQTVDTPEWIFDQYKLGYMTRDEAVAVWNEYEANIALDLHSLAQKNGGITRKDIHDFANSLQSAAGKGGSNE